MIVPDPVAEVRVDFADGSAIEHFFLGDTCNTDGSAWECCPRDFLRRAVKELEDVASLGLIAAFEQEFLYTGVSDRPGDAYALGAFRRQNSFGEIFTAALRAAGIVPDTFLPAANASGFESSNDKENEPEVTWSGSPPPESVRSPCFTFGRMRRGSPSVR